MARMKDDGSLAIKTWDGADKAVADLRELNAQIKELEGGKGQSLKTTKDLWDGRIMPHAQKKAALIKALKVFVEEHREDLGRKQSREMNHGTLGFRKSSSLKTLAKWTWARVLDVLKAKPALRRKYVRVKEDVNKEAIRSANLDADALKNMGLRLAEKEDFYVEVNSEDTINP